VTTSAQYLSVSIVLACGLSVASTLRYVPKLRKKHGKVCENFSLLSTLGSLVYFCGSVGVYIDQVMLKNRRVTTIGIIEALAGVSAVLGAGNIPVIVEVHKMLRARTG
jgi:hypothetical protein